MASAVFHSGSRTGYSLCSYSLCAASEKACLGANGGSNSRVTWVYHRYGN